MSNLSFNKNSFIKSNPTTLAKPIINNPNKLGRKTVEEIKADMYSLGKPILKEEKNKIEDLQKNNLNSFKNFREWNKK